MHVKAIQQSKIVSKNLVHSSRHSVVVESLEAVSTASVSHYIKRNLTLQSPLTFVDKISVLGVFAATMTMEDADSKCHC